MKGDDDVWRGGTLLSRQQVKALDAMLAMGMLVGFVLGVLVGVML